MDEDYIRNRMNDIWRQQIAMGAGDCCDGNRCMMGNGLLMGGLPTGEGRKRRRYGGVAVGGVNVGGVPVGGARAMTWQSFVAKFRRDNPKVKYDQVLKKAGVAWAKYKKAKNMSCKKPCKKYKTPKTRTKCRTACDVAYPPKKKTR